MSQNKTAKQSTPKAELEDVFRQTKIVSTPNLEVTTSKTVDKTDEQIVDEQPKEPFRPNKALLIGICVLVIIAVVIGIIVIVFFYNNKSDEKEDNEQKLKEALEKAQIDAENERKQSTILKMHLNDRNKQLQAATKQLEYFQNKQDIPVDKKIEAIRNKNGLPSDHDFEISELQKDNKEQQQPIQKKWSEMDDVEKKAFARQQANKPRKTVADMQAEVESVKEQNNSSADNDAREAIKGHVGAELFPVHDDSSESDVEIVNDADDEEVDEQLLKSVKNK